MANEYIILNPLTFTPIKTYTTSVSSPLDVSSAGGEKKRPLAANVLTVNAPTGGSTQLVSASKNT